MIINTESAFMGRGSPEMADLQGNCAPDRLLSPKQTRFMKWILLLAAAAQLALAAERPNILWLVAEDHSPLLGCYGDKFARTPVLDALAARALRYTRASSNAPVCAPARTAWISGMHASSTGSEHMRSKVKPPGFLKFYPELMREAGYHCTNNAKEDYNLITPAGMWDDSSGKATYQKSPAGRPFLAVFNQNASHESHLHQDLATNRDLTKMPLPPYFPDTPEIREDVARYYDQIEKVDQWVGRELKKLAKAGHADTTIVIFCSDHGNGLARAKRYPGWSGLHVPLIVYFPEKWRHLAPPGYEPGQTSDRLVSFVDFAPTFLSLAGAKVPEWLQGRAFLGASAASPPQLSFGYRGRMDERPDVCRSVTDGRFIYLRNFLPHLSHGQRYSYQQSARGARQWREMFLQGKLDPVRSAYWQPHPPEELFDLQNDPHEIRNLAGDPAHAEILRKFRGALREHLLETRDLALMPEPMMHRLTKAGSHDSPWRLARDRGRYPLERALEITELQLAPSADPAALRAAFSDSSAVIRYWAAVDLLQRGPEATAALGSELTGLWEDEEPLVRIAAAEVLATHGDAETKARALAILTQAATGESDFYTVVHALNAMDQARPLPQVVKEKLSPFPDPAAGIPKFAGSYLPRLLENLLED
jgi:arylsulfatase A-like enzyme